MDSLYYEWNETVIKGVTEGWLEQIDGTVIMDAPLDGTEVFVVVDISGDDRVARFAQHRYIRRLTIAWMQLRYCAPGDALTWIGDGGRIVFRTIKHVD